jgi:predicted RNA binding protein YcfA (HicA-like mRNA interferase family)
MSKLAIVSATQMSKILRHLGFLFVRQKGSHAYFKHSDGRATVVPIHRGEDLGRGLIRAILRDIDISPEEFEKLRHKI